VKVRTARSLLSITWVVGSVPLILIVTLQGFNQVYGPDNWDKGWLWIMPLLFPVLGIIIASWTAGHSQYDDLDMSSDYVFWLTMILSFVYLTILYAGVIVEVVVYRHSNWDFIMHSTEWFLAVFQGLISVAITKFFIENIHPV
jgi:hypothetical protein